MSPIEDKDKYVVYNGIEEGMATFSLCDRNYEEDRIVDQIAIPPEDVPEGTEYQDHFWVDLNEKGEIIEMRYDPEFTAQKTSEYQEAVDMFQKMQDQEKQRLDDDE